MSLAPGSRLGPYEIGLQIGSGGMGEVYAATDTRLDRTVAIKVLPAELAADPDRRERFEREARAIAALNHPHICTLYDVGHENGTDFLVMEHLDGESLQARLRRTAEGSGLRALGQRAVPKSEDRSPQTGTGLPLDEALTIAIQIADALDKAHRQGITHRDLKPGNIFLVGKGAARQGSPQAKLLDFGLAKLTDPVHGAKALAERSTKLADSLTTQGTILGTFHYMAPEQLEGQEADARSDIWAFGCVVYEMVTGTKAFEGTSQAGLIGAIMSDEAPSLPRDDPHVPRSLDRVTRKCLEKDRDRRWQSIGDLADELRWIVGDTGTAAEIPAKAPRRRRSVAAAVAGVMGLAIGIGLVVLAMAWIGGPGDASSRRFDACRRLAAW